MIMQRNSILVNCLMLGSVGIISMLWGACNKTTHDYRADSILKCKDKMKSYEYKTKIVCG